MRPTTTSVGRAGGERDVAEGGEPEREGDRHAGEHHRADEPDEEDQQVEVAERLQHGLQQDQHADRAPRPAPTAPSDVRARSPTLSEPQQRDDDHQPDADRQRGGAPGVRDLERRGGDEDLVGGELEGRVDDEQQEGERGRDRDHVEEGARAGREHADEGGHAHVLAALERDTEPSMASQRNRIEASSSDQTSGWWKT